MKAIHSSTQVPSAQSGAKECEAVVPESGAASTGLRFDSYIKAPRRSLRSGAHLLSSQLLASVSGEKARLIDQAIARLRQAEKPSRASEELGCFSSQKTPSEKLPVPHDSCHP